MAHHGIVWLMHAYLMIRGLPGTHSFDRDVLRHQDRRAVEYSLAIPPIWLSIRMHPSMTAILVSRFMLDLHEAYRAMAHQENLSSIQVMGSLRCDPAADEGFSGEE